jgi:DNA-binding MarR family transcriptional regulator
MATNSSMGAASAAAKNSDSEDIGNGSREVDYGVLPECIGFNLRISYALASQLFARELEDRSLAPIQFAALELIARNPDLSQREIAHHIATTPTVLVKPLEKLVAQGLLSRVRSRDDRRRARIRITAQGEELLREARRRIHTVEAQLTEKLSETERRSLLKLLHKLTDRG